MKAKKKYTNRKGEVFEIEITDGRVPPDANYFGYFAKVKHIQFGSHTYKIFILKDTANTKQFSDAFVLAEPLDYLYKLFDEMDKVGTPLYWQDIKKGWAVV